LVSRVLSWSINTNIAFNVSLRQYAEAQIKTMAAGTDVDGVHVTPVQVVGSDG
jgi:hypothetical protein